MFSVNKNTASQGHRQQTACSRDTFPVFLNMRLFHNAEMHTFGRLSKVRRHGKVSKLTRILKIVRLGEGIFPLYSRPETQKHVPTTQISRVTKSQLDPGHVYYTKHSSFFTLIWSFFF